ncbi:endo-1,4-beta-xylanase [Brevundimonas sp. DC300-4]|uniref:endo-1,4-beta-xylanase n=1 Tax=Brevundimonas sp. DC300-4 TaxID=2804594 RepID=UPI003CEEAF5D
MPNRRHLLSVTGATLLAACASTPPLIDTGTATLAALARSKGLRFGTALAGGSAPLRGALGDPTYCSLIQRECGVLVHENDLKWQVLRPSPTAFDFVPADRISAFASQSGMPMRGHTLLWQDQRRFPRWAAAYDYGSRPALTTARLLDEHIATVVGRYTDVVDSWDVVNEAVIPETGGLRRTVFSDHMGTEALLDAAFHAARVSAPSAQLVYNDYMGWGAGQKAHCSGVLRLLEGFLARGVPIDALGIQGHLVAMPDDRDGQTVAMERDWRRFLDAVTGLGLQLVITEIDVNDRELPRHRAYRDSMAAETVRRYLTLMLDYPGTTDIVCWGLADRYNWLRYEPGYEQSNAARPTPYDNNFVAKPLRNAIASVIAAAPERLARV